MSTCAACSNDYRSGTTVLLLNTDGTYDRKRVCPKCANTCLQIVVAKVAPVVEEKVVRSPDFKAIITQLQVLMRAAALGDNEHDRGRVEAYEGAIEVVRRFDT